MTVGHSINLFCGVFMNFLFVVISIACILAYSWCKLVSKSIFKVLHFVVACKVFLIAFNLLLSCYRKNFRRLNGFSDHIHVNDIQSVLWVW